MKAEYEIKENKVVRFHIETTFEEICSELSNKSERGYGSLWDIVKNKVASEIANKFLLEETGNVMAAIDPKHVANMVTLSALKTYQGNRD